MQAIYQHGMAQGPSLFQQNLANSFQNFLSQPSVGERTLGMAGNILQNPDLWQAPQVPFDAMKQSMMDIMNTGLQSGPRFASSTARITGDQARRFSLDAAQAAANLQAQLNMQRVGSALQFAGIGQGIDAQRTGLLDVMSRFGLGREQMQQQSLANIFGPGITAALDAQQIQTGGGFGSFMGGLLGGIGGALMPGIGNVLGPGIGNWLGGMLGFGSPGQAAAAAAAGSGGGGGMGGPGFGPKPVTRKP